MSEEQAIAAFLGGTVFAVAGASNDRHKYGNRVLRCYWQTGRKAYPLNPGEAKIEGRPAFPGFAALPEAVFGLSLVTQPDVSVQVVSDALEHGVRHFWFQPGAEHEIAIERARSAGATVIAHGACVLVVLGYRGG